MKIWICTEGDYSDASVAAVFSKEEDARKAERVFGWGVEEAEVDPFSLDDCPPEPGLKAFRATLHLDVPHPLNAIYVREDGSPPFGWNAAGEGLLANLWYGSFWARDQKHADEIASAKWRELVASSRPA